MATAKKTSSGMWKCRAYSHTDENGKQHYRAFYAPTKAEAEQLASQFSDRMNRASRNDLTVGEALEGYIETKSGMLSPSTVRGYVSMIKYFDPISATKIRKLQTANVQKWISDLAARLSPKTVSNIYGLFTACVALYAPERNYRINLPQKQKKRAQSASDADVMKLYAEASPNLKRAIALGAFTSMRRGEICALCYGDINGNIAHIHADMVRGRDGWHIKPTPKTSDSDRFVRLPDSVINLIGSGAPDEHVVPITPDTITECFGRLRDSLGIEMRFHDLRHYFASIAAVLAVPDTYTTAFGGWRPGSNVMKQVYQNTIESESDRYAAKMTDHFDALIQKHDPKHDLEK